MANISWRFLIFIILFSCKSTRNSSGNNPESNPSAEEEVDLGELAKSQKSFSLQYSDLDTLKVSSWIIHQEALGFVFQANQGTDQSEVSILLADKEVMGIIDPTLGAVKAVRKRPDAPAPVSPPKRSRDDFSPTGVYEFPLSATKKSSEPMDATSPSFVRIKAEELNAAFLRDVPLEVLQNSSSFTRNTALHLVLSGSGLKAQVLDVSGIRVRLPSKGIQRSADEALDVLILEKQWTAWDRNFLGDTPLLLAAKHHPTGIMRIISVLEESFEHASATRVAPIFQKVKAQIDLNGKSALYIMCEETGVIQRAINAAKLDPSKADLVEPLQARHDQYKVAIEAMLRKEVPMGYTAVKIDSKGNKVTADFNSWDAASPSVKGMLTKFDQNARIGGQWRPEITYP